MRTGEGAAHPPNRITAEELAALGERVRAFANVVERVCREKIASLRAAAEAPGAE